MIAVKPSAATPCLARKPSKYLRCCRHALQCCGLYLCCLSLAWADAELMRIHQLYEQLLEAHVYTGEKNNKALNLVDYAALRRDERLPQVLQLVKSYPLERLDSPHKKMAFYLNAYNLLAMHKVTEHWPLQKLKSLGSFYRPVWTHYAGQVCGEKMTLRQLEHGILRKLGEPRIHFALNCASVSCPDLRTEPYVADRLEAQLEDQTRVFLSQANKGMEIQGRRLTLSPLFDWFAEDFAPSGDVLAFLKPYLPANQGEWKIVGYFEYDWEINDHLTTYELNRIKRRRDTWFN